jgi:nonsense-mediated mRNA decay protein 3
MIRYCPICNKSSDETPFVGELCLDCTVKEYEKKMKIPETVKINVCRSCGKVGTSMDSPYENYSKSAVARTIESAIKIKECKVRLVTFEGDTASVELKCDIDGELATFDRKFIVKVGRQMCKPCSLKAGGYYEALFQLRGDPQKCIKTMERLTKFVERRGGFISKSEDVQGGYDIYISSKDITALFIKMYELKPIRSFQLYGVRNGKKVYRNIYSLRFGS